MVENTIPGTGQYPKPEQRQGQVVQRLQATSVMPEARPQAYTAPLTSAPMPQGKPPLHFLDKKIIIPLAVIVLLLIGVGLYLVFTAPAEEIGAVLPATVDQGISPALTTVEENESISYSEMLGDMRTQVMVACDNIQEPTGPGSRDLCLLTFANWSGDYWYCEEMVAESGNISSDSCYLKLAVQKNDSDLCEFMTESTGEFSRDQCYMELAKGLDQVYLCDTLSMQEGPISKTACISQFGMTEQQFKESIGEIYPVSDCDSYTDLDDKELCIKALAVETGNGDLCAQLSNVQGNLSKNSCYTDVAMETKDIKYCDMIDETGLRQGEVPKEDCQYFLAVQTGDISLCDELTNPVIVADCKATVQDKVLDALDYQV